MKKAAIKNQGEQSFCKQKGRIFAYIKKGTMTGL